MLATFSGGVPRQSAVITAIAALHVGAFLVIATGLGPQVIRELTRDPPPVILLPPEKQPLVLVKPQPALPDQPYYEPVAEPVVPLPDFQEAKRTPAPAVIEERGDAGAGPRVPVAEDYVPPRLKSRDARLAALVAACYPAASRRLGEEGRAVAIVTIGTDGRALRWRLARSSGYSRLDQAVGCVIEQLAFVAGRRDGRAVAAEAELPVAFRLN